MDPIRDLDLTQGGLNADDDLTGGIPQRVLEKLHRQLEEGISVLQGRTAPTAVNHRCRTVAVVEMNNGTILYAPSVRSIRSTAKGTEVTLAHPDKKRSITKRVNAKSAQIIRY